MKTLIPFLSLLAYSCSQLPVIPSTNIHPDSPIIIVPGIMGSQLVDPRTGNVIWGKILDLQAVDPHEAILKPEVDGLELPVDQRPITSNKDRLIPTAVLPKYQMINRVAEVEAYESLIEQFSQCGLQAGDLRNCTAQDNLYLFAYDWRRDLVETARLFGEQIEAIQQVSANPHQKVTVIAHSMGGLIVTYYLLYGREDVISGIERPQEIPPPTYAGAANIDQIFFLGVPFGGSPYAAKSLNEGEYLGPFVDTPSWTTFTMLSIYEMLPLEMNDVVVKPDGAPLEVNLFDVRTWVDNGMSIFNDREWSHFEEECSLAFPVNGPAISRERRSEFESFVREALQRGYLFQSALHKVDWDRIEARKTVIAGNCEPTLRSLEWRTDREGQPHIRSVKSRKLVEKYLHTDTGDGTVLLDTQMKISKSANKVMFGCYKHRALPSDPEVQQLILTQLVTSSRSKLKSAHH